MPDLDNAETVTVRRDPARLAFHAETAVTINGQHHSSKNQANFSCSRSGEPSREATNRIMMPLFLLLYRCLRSRKPKYTSSLVIKKKKKILILLQEGKIVACINPSGLAKMERRFSSPLPPLSLPSLLCSSVSFRSFSAVGGGSGRSLALRIHGKLRFEKIFRMIGNGIVLDFLGRILRMADCFSPTFLSCFLSFSLLFV